VEENRRANALNTEQFKTLFYYRCWDMEKAYY
jgi:hypothetical protein